MLNLAENPHFLRLFLCRSAFSPYLCQRIKEQCIMQQATINFTASEVRQPVSLRERMRSTGRAINEWLDTKSAFYSRIAEFEVTRRVAIRVNLVTVAMLVAAVAIETAPVAALAAALSVAWVMFRILIGKKGGRA